MHQTSPSERSDPPLVSCHLPLIRLSIKITESLPTAWGGKWAGDVNAPGGPFSALFRLRSVWIVDPTGARYPLECRTNPLPASQAMVGSSRTTIGKAESRIRLEQTQKKKTQLIRSH